MFRAESYVGHKLCWPDDLVINSLWAWGRGLGVAQHHGIVSTAYGVYRQRDFELEPSYLHELVRSEPFQWELQVRSQGVWKSRLQMTDDRWLDAPLLVPPTVEQAAIVKYLAHANARIDKAIAAKRQLSALLEEQRERLHGEVLGRAAGAGARLKHHATIQTGVTLGKDYGGQEVSEYPYLRVANVQMGHVDTDDIATVSIPRREAGRYSLRPGDVLMTEGGDLDKLGRGTVWDGSISPCLHQNHVFSVRCRKGLLPEYLAAWLAGPVARQYFHMTGKKTTNLASTNSTTVGELPIIVPTLADQTGILQEIIRENEPLLAALDRAEREIDLLEEFRARLVADVVTGQVDVRAIAASLPGTPEAVETPADGSEGQLEEAFDESED